MAQTTHERALGKIPLKAAGAVTASGINALTPEVRKGAFDLFLEWASIVVNTSDEIYVIVIEGQNAAGSWVEIAPRIVLGHTTVLAGAGTSPATGKLKVGVKNPFAGAVRSRHYIAGTVGAGLNYTLDIYPLEDLKI